MLRILGVSLTLALTLVFATVDVSDFDYRTAVGIFGAGTDRPPTSAIRRDSSNSPCVAPRAPPGLPFDPPGSSGSPKSQRCLLKSPRLDRSA